MARGKTLDQQGIGSEPIWDSTSQPTGEERQLVLIKTFSYYNYFNGYKDAKIIICDYLSKNKDKETAQLVKKAPDMRFNKSIAWLAKMAMNGFELAEEEVATIKDEISRLTKIAKQIIEAKSEDETSKPKKPNVQEIMRERAMEVGGELEGLLDDYIASGIPAKHKIKPIGLLMTTTMLPQHVPLLLAPWEAQKKEFEELQTTEDKDLLEAYSNLGKIQIRNLIKFCELVIHDLHSYVTYKKSTRAKPKKKAVPIAKLVGKLKYLKKYDELKLESLSPTKIPESTEMFAYDTKKRKMHYYKADALSGGLTVKNSTIIGFSASESCIKTLRKPKEQLKEFKSASKPNSRKFFSDIKAVETKTTGRFNENIVILKIFN
jgi:hypothetical protein